MKAVQRAQETPRMKHKGALADHLQRFQLLKKELRHRKEDVVEELNRLHRLYNHTLTQIDSQQPCPDSEPGASVSDSLDRAGEDAAHQEEPEGKGHTSQDILDEITNIFDNARLKLNNAAIFLDLKVKELMRIKRQFQNEYPLVVKELVKRDLGSQEHLDESSQEDFKDKKNSAVVKMVARLKNLRTEVSQRLEEDCGRCELEDFLFKRHMLNGEVGDRKRSRTKPTLTVVSPHGTRRLTSSRLSKSADFVSKERLLNKAKSLRATKKVHALSDNSLFLLSSKNRRRKLPRIHSVSGSKASSLTALNRVSGTVNDSFSSIETTDDSDSGGQSKAEVIQVPEVTSSVQDRLKTPSPSHGVSLTESSLMTESTVSATQGDSSLQVSCDKTEDKGAPAHEANTDSVTPVVTDSSCNEERKSREEISAKRREALSRPRSSKGGSRYIQIGLPEQRNTSDVSPETQYSGNKRFQSYPSYHRGGRPNLRYMPGLYNHRLNTYRRAQSSHSAYRQPCYPGTRACFPSQYSGVRRAQSCQPANRGNRSYSRAAGYRSTIHRLAQWSRLRPAPRAVHEPGWSDRQLTDSGVARRSLSSGVSSSYSSSSSPGGSEDRSETGLKDTLENSCGEADLLQEDLVTVKLINSQSVHRHLGPGLLSHRTQVDCFAYPKEKTLQALSDFVLERLGVYKRGRVRLWLFEEDQDGLFLPRRLLTGNFVTNTIDSLQRDTVTLYVQAPDHPERLYSFDHNKVRFVFVKTPHWKTGEFVVRGHHQVDITKATRAVVQVLKKKFMPRCASPIRLYIETGGKMMYQVPYTPASTLNEDMEGRSRHGDIMLLVEEYIDNQSIPPGAVSRGCEKERGQLVPLSPYHGLPLCKTVLNTRPPRYSQSCSDDQGEGSVDSRSSPSLQQCVDNNHNHNSHNNNSHSHNRNSHSDGSDGGQGGDGVLDSNGCSSKTDIAQPSAPDPVGGATATVPEVGNFIIPCDYTTSASDESSSSLHSGHHRPGQRQPFPQWDLTNNYLSRFSRQQQQEEEELEGESCSRTEEQLLTDMAAADISRDSVAEKGSVDSEYSPNVSDKTDIDSVEYDSVDVTGRSAMISSDYYDESFVSKLVEEEESVEDSSNGKVDTAAVHAEQSQGDRPRGDLSTHSFDDVEKGQGLTSHDPDRHCPDTAGEPLKVTESKNTSVPDVELSACQDMSPAFDALQTGKDIAARDAVNERPCAEREKRSPSKAGRLNPVAPVFTPRTAFRAQQRTADRTAHTDLHFGSRGFRGSVRSEDDVTSDVAVKDDLRKAGKDPNAASFTPRTPHSAVSNNSVFTSDEGENSVYYTPRPAFVFPDPTPRLQSTAMGDINTSEDCDASRLAHLQSHSQVNPEQISAITNRSSSFMAIRLPRLPADQISAIPNISSSFMDIPSQAQIHTSPFSGHSVSFSALRQQQNRSSHDTCPTADSSFCQPGATFDTSHVQATSGVSSLRSGCQYTQTGKSGKAARTEMKREGSINEGTTSEQCVAQVNQAMAEDRAPHRPRSVARSEASVVKRDDPAIMDIGQKVLVIAQKSSLNANAMEFVPKEAATCLEEPQVKKMISIPELIVKEKLSACANGLRQYPYGGQASHPTVRLTNTPGAGQQRPLITVPHRREATPTLTSTRPLAYPPVNTAQRLTPDQLYSTLKHQMVPRDLTAPKLPTLGSLTDGSSDTGLPPKPPRSQDTSRHVTFADQLGSRSSQIRRATDANCNVYSLQQRPFYMRGPRDVKAAQLPGDKLQETVPLRRKIGSGRFDDRPKRYSGELRRPQHVQREPSGPFHKPSADSFGDRPQDPRPYSSQQSAPHKFCNGAAQSGYGERKPSHVQTNVAAFHRGQPASGGRQQAVNYVSAEHQQDWGPSYPAPSIGHHPYRRTGRPDRGWQGQGPSSGDTHPRYAGDTHPRYARSYRSSPGEEFPYRERGPYRGVVNRGRHADQRVWRRPVRHLAANSSSDQSDSGLSSGRKTFPGPQRQANKAPHESETEISLGSGTFHSETSNNDSIQEASADTRDCGSGQDSSDSKTTQSSGSSKQSLRIRRGYIQLGLGDASRPASVQAVNESNR